MEARQHKRVAVFPVQYFLTYTYLGEAVVGKGKLSNLSPGGCNIEGDRIIITGAVVKLHISLPDHDAPVEIEQATVRWALGRKFGVEFIRMQPEMREELDRFVSTLETGPSH